MERNPRRKVFFDKEQEGEKHHGMQKEKKRKKRNEKKRKEKKREGWQSEGKVTLKLVGQKRNYYVACYSTLLLGFLCSLTQYLYIRIYIITEKERRK